MADVGSIVLGMALIALALQPMLASAQPSGTAMYAVTASNRLLQFNSADPATIAAQQPISGLQAGEAILGIDFRPATAQLFALGSSNRLYMIDTQTGGATAIGTQPITLTLEGTSFGFDFNPTVDRIRLVSNAGQDLRLNPNNGVVGAIDGRLAFASGDANAGAQPSVVAAGYTNSVAGATSTVLYVIESGRDLLATQGTAGNPPVSPNTGQLFTVGALGIDVGEVVSFDIAQSGMGYVAYATGNASDFATIDLTSGRLTRTGTIGGGEVIRGLAAVTVAPPAAPTATIAPAPTTAPAPTIAPTSVPPVNLPPTGEAPMPVGLPDTGASALPRAVSLILGSLLVLCGLVLRRTRISGQGPGASKAQA